MISTHKIARFSGLLLAALSTGVLFGTKVALGRSSKGFAPKTYVEVQQATVRNLRPVLSNLTALGLTGIFELPINARVLTWSPENPPVGWEASRDRWEAVDTARTAVSVVGLGCLVAAALIPTT